MTTRIVKTEKFIAKIGNPVFQITEETTLASGQVMRLDPRTPNADELADANESFSASQQLLISTLEVEKVELTEQLTAANARIAALLQEVPFNPRILKGEAFYNRVSKEDMVTLLTSENPQLVVVGKTIEAYRANKWPVVLDSDDFQQLVGYVLQSGVFDEQEVLAIMTDATRDEAYGTE